jgi:hypothetical protein
MIKDMQPGRYRTRDGRVAVVVGRETGYTRWAWRGELNGEEEHWSDAGEWSHDAEPHGRDLVARLADDPDGRIERALQVLREAQTYHHFEGGWDGGGVLLPARANDGDWVEADMVKRLRKILEDEQQ